MNRIFFLTILWMLFIQSCTNKDLPNSTSEDPPIVIDITSVKQDSLKLNYVQYIPLETSSEFLIGGADKVLIRNNRIYVADFGNMSLFIFDMNGQFLLKIANRGQGPGEYVSFNDFDISIQGDIYIFDPYRKKILMYNSKGEWLQDVDVDYYLFNFCLIGDKMYFSRLVESGKMYANLALYNRKDKKTDFILTDEKFLHDPGLMNFSAYDFYYSPDQIVYYAPKFSELIYSIGEEGIRPAIGIQNLKIPSKDVINEWLQEKDRSRRYDKMRESNYFMESVYIYETDKYISVGCASGLDRNSLLYNKQSKSACIVWDIFQTLGIGNAGGSTGKNFFGVVTFNPDNGPHKRILKSRKELANWKEDDNPVIVLFEPAM